MTKPPSSGTTESSHRALVFMAMLSLQFGIQPIMNQKFVSKKIIMSTVIFAQEVVKLIVGVVGISLGRTPWADVASGELFFVVSFPETRACTRFSLESIT